MYGLFFFKVKLTGDLFIGLAIKMIMLVVVVVVMMMMMMMMMMLITELHYG